MSVNKFLEDMAILTIIVLLGGILLGSGIYFGMDLFDNPTEFHNAYGVGLMLSLIIGFVSYILTLED